MRKAVVSNTNGTLIVDPMEYTEFKEKFIKLYGNPGLIEPGKRMDCVRELRKKMKEKGEYSDSLCENVPLLLNDIRVDMGFIIFAGAPVEKTIEIYDRFSLPIDGAYIANGMDRGNTGTFVLVGDTIRNSHCFENFEPIAYLTNDPWHALASARAWGKGIVVVPGKNKSGMKFNDKGGREGSIYAIAWEDMENPEERERLISFIKRD